MNNTKSGAHIVDLSHSLIPSKEQYKLTVSPQEIRKGPKAVLYDVDFWTHVGTHVEYALHFIPFSNDMAKLPLRRVIGPAVRVDMRSKEVNEPIDIEDFEPYDIQKGDIVTIWTRCEPYYRTTKSHDRPYVTKRAAEWLANDLEIRSLGIDASGFEVRGGKEYEPNHFLFFDREDPIPVYECLRGLGELKHNRYFFITLPLSVEEVDSWPLRILGIEGQDEDHNLTIVGQLSEIFSSL